MDVKVFSYFWGGTEATQYNALYNQANPPVNGPLIIYTSTLAN
jgi:hypothetical protein